MATNSGTTTVTDQGPAVFEFDRAPDPFDALASLHRQEYCLLLDSAMTDAEVGRYSFLMANPTQTFEIESDQPLETGQNPFIQVEEVLQSFPVDSLPGLPPFQGGAAGLLSYELNQSFENIENEKPILIPTPKMAIGIYDIVLAWDHFANRAWLISQGFPARTPSERQLIARTRIEEFLTWLEDDTFPVEMASPFKMPDSVPIDQYTIPQLNSITSNLDERGYLDSVETIIEYIHAGDIFQANFAQSLLSPALSSPLSLYSNLRSCNAAPFAAYFDLGTTQVLSASPERFFSVRDRKVQTRPIKGTRRRTCYPEADLPTSLQLQTSEKDRAENIMIVDLLRNDLSRVCEDESVVVKKLCQVESFRSVLHLVSIIEAQLKSEYSVFDLLRATFPGGSITGAPKVRAMEIIAELEPSRRGAYCGSIGYIGFDGTSDFNILIRTLSANEFWWQIPVGGGIVAASNPAREYDETWTKAAGMLRAIKESEKPCSATSGGRP